MKKCGCVYQRASVVGARERNSNCIAVNKRLKRQRTFGMRNSETVLTTVRNHRLSKAKELRIKTFHRSHVLSRGRGEWTNKRKPEGADSK